MSEQEDFTKPAMASPRKSRHWGLWLLLILVLMFIATAGWLEYTDIEVVFDDGAVEGPLAIVLGIFGVVIALLFAVLAIVLALVAVLSSVVFAAAIVLGVVGLLLLCLAPLSLPLLAMIAVPLYLLYRYFKSPTETTV